MKQYHCSIFSEDETMTAYSDIFGARARLESARGAVSYSQLRAITKRGEQSLDRLPFTDKIPLENALLNPGAEIATGAEVLSLALWVPSRISNSNLTYTSTPA